MPTRYFLRLPDTAHARGGDPELAFRSQSAEGMATELQEALRSDALFQRWRARQDDPDGVDPTLGATDPGASVQGSQHDLHVELVATTSLSGNLLKQRLRWLAGSGWELRDVTAA
ncbi:hypothetical protein FNZ56_08200 [Pseudoluteimonas lycopersici]|uniref:Uncharacterized protein n=1 Tax=Pseudoluteimonas lycopersici TaxID=1324796 RepID=A0A516V5Q5_9GAMM|nr:hypothetical protein [Lysobacter lycopersici]QDQ73859.1 hypothetical protein FNZ56_08200 [Lysobacter lycopersici]